MKEKRAALIAAIDSGNLVKVEEFTAMGMPDGAAGTILLAARACGRVRQAAADAIAAACEGRLTEARELAGEAGRQVAMMHKRLDTAASLNARTP